VFIQRPDAELMCIAARIFDASLSTRRKIVQGVHAALTACTPIATFVRCWLSHRGHRL
jgi:hypothetical protein